MRRDIDIGLLRAFVAVVETGVPVWALDAERVNGPLGLRGARAGERLGAGRYAHDLAPGVPRENDERSAASRIPDAEPAVPARPPEGPPPVP